MQTFFCEKDEFKKEVRGVDAEHAAEKFMEDLWSNNDYWEAGLDKFSVKVDGEIYDVYPEESISFTAAKRKDQ
jgi:hypothetical protein